MHGSGQFHSSGHILPATVYNTEVIIHAAIRQSHTSGAHGVRKAKRLGAAFLGFL